MDEHVAKLYEVILGCLERPASSVGPSAVVCRAAPVVAGRASKRMYVIAGCVLAVLLSVAATVLLRGTVQSKSQELSTDDKDQELLKLWRLQDWQKCYQAAIQLQKQHPADPSVPAYWRVMCYQSMHYAEWCTAQDPAAIRALELEYEQALPAAGARTDVILYQCAHFYRLTNREQKGLALLQQMQQQFPNSNWKEGNAFYLGLLYAKAGSTEQALQQLARLRKFDLDGRMYSFEKKEIISLNEAVRLLEESLQLGTKP